jgi:chromosome segregation ATPase
MWGRRKEGLRTVQAMVDELGEERRNVDGLLDRLDDEVKRVEGLLGRGDGVPRGVVESLLDDARRTFDRAEDGGRRQHRTFQDMARAAAADRRVDAQEMATLRGEFDDGMSALREVSAEAEALLSALRGLRGKLEELPEKLGPVRGRIHAALEAARRDLESLRLGGASGFRHEAELTRLTERLAALEQGGYHPTPERGPTRHFADLEAEVAALRDAMAAPGH